MRFRDKVVVVTGGSRGIGYATAEAFLEEGARVAVAASRRESADAAAQKLREAHPGTQVMGISPNLARLEQVRSDFDRIGKAWGGIDVLINNAGISESTPFLEYTGEVFEKVMALNVTGVFNAARAAGDWMARQGGGVILNTSSMVSFLGQSTGVAYPVSKFAVNGLTVSLARELGPKGIRVNAVAPGFTQTDMMRAVPSAVVDPLIARIPLGRLGTPRDIANAFVFLASGEAAYITGVILRVDGMASN